MHSPVRIPIRLLSGAVLLTMTTPGFAASFSDVPKNHFALNAINYLSDRGIFSGYKDGSFKPNAKVNRAEALKIIATSVGLTGQNARSSKVEFDDVPENAWYMPSLEWAVGRKVVDGPDKFKNFRPAAPVTKSEFLKMLFVGNAIDLKAFNDIELALASDVTDTEAWYYPVLRYAVATGTTVQSDSGMYGPARELTRGDVALLLYQFTLYKNNQHTQELLMLTKQNVEKVITALSAGDVRQAEYASARAILIARGALMNEPNEAIVKVAVKIAEGYRALTRAYRASLNNDTAGVLKHATDGSTLAAQAKKISITAKALAEQLDVYCKDFIQQVKEK